MSELAVGNGNELPDSWTTAAFEEVATLSPRFSATDVDATDLVHFVPMAAVAEDFGGMDVSQLRPYGDVRKGYTSFSEGDVLFAKITPCMENGKGALVPHLPHKHAFGSTEFHVLRPEAAVQPKWLAHYLSQPDFRRVARQNMAGTAGQLRVPTRWLAAAGIPVPPLAEQTRIVEKLEELLSDLDAGVAELKAAQRKLAQYRQSLLKAAVEGALTADWRAARHSYDYPPRSSSPRKRGSTGLAYPGVMDSRFRGNDGQSETGADPLQRILTERRARWETRQLAKFAEQGKTPPKDWQAKYPEPVAPETTGLPELPDGWAWATLDQLMEKIVDGTHHTPTYVASGIPFISVKDIRNGEISFDECRYISKDEHSELIKRCHPQPGDLLVTKSGTIGRTALVDTSKEFSLFVSVALLKPTSELINMRWVDCSFSAWFQSINVTNEVKGTAVKNLHLEDFRGLVMQLPPIEEQVEALQVFSARWADANDLLGSIEISLNQSAAQRKNILKAAFAGQLVPQDPNDEPASVLLERISAARVGRADKAKPEPKRGRKA